MSDDSLWLTAREQVRVYCERCGADLGDVMEPRGPGCHAVFCRNCGWKPECE